MCPGFWTETMFDIFALVWRKDNYSSAISKIYKRQLFIYICTFLSVRILEYLNTLALKQQNINVTIMSNISFYNIRDQSLKAVPFILVEPFFCFYTACLSSLCIHILFIFSHKASYHYVTNNNNYKKQRMLNIMWWKKTCKLPQN